MKRILLICCVLLLGAATSSNADFFNVEGAIVGTWSDEYKGYYWDSTIGSDSYDKDQWSGYFIGYFDGNDSQYDLELLAETYLGYGLSGNAYDKVDPLTSTPSNGENNFLTAFGTVANEDDEFVAGEWSVVSPYALGFYAVKGSDGFALYYVDPYQSSGYWSTIHLPSNNQNLVGISHLSALPEVVQVPEPATMLLLGMGLLGMASFSRRRLLKK